MSILTASRLENALEKHSDYHHGSLRRALIETGLELISEKGVSAFTLRELAKRAGVSTAAPYHHFRNKAELLEAMAAEGWRMMGEGFEASSAAEETPRERLYAIGRAYITFALEHTPYFRVMSRPDLYCTEEESDYSGTGLEVFEMLKSAVTECYPDRDRSDPVIQATVLNAWVQVHGFSMLWIDGPIRTTSLGKLGVEELMKLLFKTPVTG